MRRLVVFLLALSACSACESASSGATPFGSLPTSAGRGAARGAASAARVEIPALVSAPATTPYARARAALESGDADRALAEIRRVPSGAVPAPYLSLLRARALAARGETSAALAEGRSAARADTRLAVARRAQDFVVAILLSDRRGAEARREILLSGTGSSADTFLLAEGDLLVGDTSLAAANLVEAALGPAPRGGDLPAVRARAVRRLLSLESDDRAPRIPQENLARLAQAAADGGEADASATLWRRAQAAARTPVAKRRAGLGVARALVRGDRFQEAIEAFRRLPPGGEGADEAAYQIAVNLERVGKDRDAERAYDAFLARHPRSDLRADGLWRRALLIERLRGPEHGVRALRDLLRRAPRSGWADAAAWRIGTILFQAGETNEAVAAFREVVRKHPHSDFAPGMRYWIARAAEIAPRPDPDEAREGFLEILLEGRDPYYRLRALEGLRRVLGPEGATPRALDAIEREAEAALRRGDTAEAIGHLRVARLLNADPARAARLRSAARDLSATLPDWRDAASAERALTSPTAFASLFSPTLPPARRGRADRKEETARRVETERRAARISSATLLAEAGGWEEAAEEVSGLSSESTSVPARLVLSYCYALGGKPLLSIREAAGATRSCEPALLPAEMPAFIARLLYPLHYAPMIERAATREGLDPLLVRSIVREESRFEAEILSRAGAQGLMQLIPPTADRVARDLGIFSPVLSDPATNLSLGTRYYARMRDRFGGRDVLALCAYNAGPANASRWLRASGATDTSPLSIPEDLFIERITFRETREYVKRILGTRAAYAELLATE